MYCGLLPSPHSHQLHCVTVSSSESHRSPAVNRGPGDTALFSLDGLITLCCRAWWLLWLQTERDHGVKNSWSGEHQFCGRCCLFFRAHLEQKWPSMQFWKIDVDYYSVLCTLLVHDIFTSKNSQQWIDVTFKSREIQKSRKCQPKDYPICNTPVLTALECSVLLIPKLHVVKIALFIRLQLHLMLQKQNARWKTVMRKVIVP